MSAPHDTLVTALSEHFGQRPARASVSFVGVEPIEVLRFEPQTPRFACTCSRERVANMIRGLGQAEADSIVAEQGEIDVACDFCGQQYRFDAVDAAQLFAAPGDQPPATGTVQ